MRRLLLGLTVVIVYLSPMSTADEGEQDAGWVLITTDPARDVEFAQEYLAVWMAVEEIDLLSMHTRETTEYREIAIEVAHLTPVPRFSTGGHWIAFGFLVATGEGFVGDVHTLPSGVWHFSADIYHPDGRIEPLAGAAYREEGNTIVFQVPKSKIPSEPVEWSATSSMKPQTGTSNSGGLRFFDAMTPTWPHTVLPVDPIAQANPLYAYPRGTD